MFTYLPGGVFAYLPESESSNRATFSESVERVHEVLAGQKETDRAAELGIRIVLTPRWGREEYGKHHSL